jgi:hypothetical protein
MDMISENLESAPHLLLQTDRYALSSLIDILDRMAPTYDNISIARLIASIRVPINSEGGHVDSEATQCDSTESGLIIKAAVITPNPSSNSSSYSWDVEPYDAVGDPFAAPFNSLSILPSAPNPPLALDAYELGLTGAEERAISLLAEALRWRQREAAAETECEEEKQKRASDIMAKMAGRKEEKKPPAGWDKEWAKWVRNH